MPNEGTPSMIVIGRPPLETQGLPAKRLVGTRGGQPSSSAFGASAIPVLGIAAATRKACGEPTQRIPPRSVYQPAFQPAAHAAAPHA